MSLERLDLSGEICVSEGCTVLTFNDTTGFKVSACADEQNDEGYGLTDGILLDDVTKAILNVYFVGQTTPFKFTFTIVNHVITACTLTDLNGDITTITADLESTVFPLTDFVINLEDYGVTFPALVDGIVTWDYTISGTSDVLTTDEPFSYTTSDGQLVDCTVDCCLENKYLELNSSCECIDGKIDNLILGEIFLWGSRFAMNVGQDDKVNDFMAKANEICNDNCKDC